MTELHLQPRPRLSVCPLGTGFCCISKADLKHEIFPASGSHMLLTKKKKKKILLSYFETGSNVVQVYIEDLKYLRLALTF